MAKGTEEEKPFNSTPTVLFPDGAKVTPGITDKNTFGDNGQPQFSGGGIQQKVDNLNLHLILPLYLRLLLVEYF